MTPDRPSLTGKTVLITGGTTGIGLATARALLAGGAEVMVTGRSPENVATAQRELSGGARVVRSDTSRLPDIEALARMAQEVLGELDLLFVNAGIALLENHDQVTEASYDQTFAVNTRGAYFTVQRFAPLIRRGGAIVLTTSIANETGTPGMAVYAGSKAALRSFARSFAAELLPRGIRVNAVSPGFIRTPTMGATGASAEARAAFAHEGEVLTPMKRIGTPEEVARAVLFLAFEATFTTGIELPVDGGLAQGLTVP